MARLHAPTSVGAGGLPGPGGRSRVEYPDGWIIPILQSGYRARPMTDAIPTAETAVASKVLAGAPDGGDARTTGLSDPQRPSALRRYRPGRRCIRILPQAAGQPWPAISCTG